MGNARMKKIFMVILLVFLFLGCATIPQGPLKSDEVRLTDLKIIETGDSGNGKLYKAIVRYQHGEKIRPEDIRAACTTWDWSWKT
ncbi:MAG: hypothetical protein A2Y65_04800 [Deltaproteobacteria bacterium RBG_13_52_11]|nr:MAG: hypothetical protein A2Y65_04800 [Deltaproteobacteria bacterium RBG_13_52_11]